MSDTATHQKNTYCVEVFPRQESGTSAMRRARRANQIPAVVYGGSKPVENIYIDRHHLNKAIEHPAFHSHLIDLSMHGQAQKVVLKHLQMHPCSERVYHVDFMRVSATTRLTMEVPLAFVGADVMPGSKEGGQLEHNMTSISVNCLPADLPMSIAVDVSGMHLGDTLHLSELMLPKGVALTIDISGDHDHPVCSVHKVFEQIIEEEVQDEGSEDDTKADDKGEASGDDKSSDEASSASDDSQS